MCSTNLLLMYARMFFDLTISYWLNYKALQSKIYFTYSKMHASFIAICDELFYRNWHYLNINNDTFYHNTLNVKATIIQ